MRDQQEPIAAWSGFDVQKARTQDTARYAGTIRESSIGGDMPGLAIGHSHGGVRGAEQSTRSPLFEGRFGRMFRRLHAAVFSERALHALATQMIAAAEDAPTPETEIDDEENQGISAGYTYLGQFIDHDLTFDPASSLQKQNDPEALEDFRTPRFDLDSVYGRGPNDQPYLYDDDGRHMLLGRRLTGNRD